VGVQVVLDVGDVHFACDCAIHYKYYRKCIVL